MKNLYLIFLVFLFITCNKEEGSLFLDQCQGECDEWERCINVSMFPSVDMRCRPLLSIYYSGYWNGQLNIVDDLGNSFTEELLNLNPICAKKYIMLPYPLSRSAFYSNNGIYPDTELNYLDLEFTDPISLEFIINDSIYDPFVESIVFYQGTGQIKNTNGSAHAILEFNCEYFFEDHTFSVSFSATR